jgi:hypothetical protein
VPAQGRHDEKTAGYGAIIIVIIVTIVVTVIIWLLAQWLEDEKRPEPVVSAQPTRYREVEARQ